MKRILSIDGGGCLGIGAAQFIDRLETATRRPVWDIFDGFAGTSTGAIIAAMLATRATGRELVELYRHRAPTIFEAPPLLWKLNPRRPRYDGRGLAKACADVFGDLTLGQAKKPLFIGYSDFGQKKPRVFDRVGNASTPLARAVQISCSAPTYFPPIDDRFADGGLLLNNPAMAGATGFAREIGAKVGDIAVMSIGTGGIDSHPIKVSAAMSLVRWVKPLTTFWMSGNESITDFYCRQVGLGGYVRFTPVLAKPFEMDDTGEMEAYRSIWDDYFADVGQVAVDFVSG